jgi:hypothetical protein
MKCWRLLCLARIWAGFVWPRGMRRSRHKGHWRFNQDMIPLISLHMKLEYTLDRVCVGTGRPHLD